MHTLARAVRFSVNPFLPRQPVGFNSYASKPPGEGLAFFFELTVHLTGEVDPNTGFVVNVLDIDEQVIEYVVPIFAARVKEHFSRGGDLSLEAMGELLWSARDRLAGRFGAAEVTGVDLALNPYTKIAIDSKVQNMVYYSEKFEFAATHRLWNEALSPEENERVFGKCASPNGHGHNYTLEVTVVMPEGYRQFRSGEFERIVNDLFLRFVDHKNLNVDVAELGSANPTVENIAALAWEKLAGKFGEIMLHRVTVWETDRTFCSYCRA